MISVVIPVHNSEKTISKCLKSVLDQTYSDFEIVLVENGSNDNSLEMCEELSQEDSRIKVFSIEPSNGPSKARNYALDHITGDQVVFIDSDDYVEKKLLEQVSKNLKDSDAVFIGYQIEKKDGRKIAEIIPHITTNDVVNASLELNEIDCFGYTWVKALKKNAIKNIRFDEDLNLFEDEKFILEVLDNCQRISVISEVLYHYVDNGEALTSKRHIDMIHKKDVLFNVWKNFLNEKEHQSLVEKANTYVRFCQHYIYEKKLDLKDSYKKLIRTHFFEIACEDPTPFTKVFIKGYHSFKKDYYIWLFKNKIRK